MDPVVCVSQEWRQRVLVCLLRRTLHRLPPERNGGGGEELQGRSRFDTCRLCRPRCRRVAGVPVLTPGRRGDAFQRSCKSLAFLRVCAVRCWCSPMFWAIDIRSLRVLADEASGREVLARRVLLVILATPSAAEIDAIWDRQLGARSQPHT